MIDALGKQGQQLGTELPVHNISSPPTQACNKIVVKCLLLTKAAGPIGQSWGEWSSSRRVPQERPPNHGPRKRWPRQLPSSQPARLWQLSLPSWLTRSSGSSAVVRFFDRHPTLLENCSPTVNHHAQHTTPDAPTTAPLHSPLTCDCEVRSFAPIFAAAHSPYSTTSAQQEHE